MKSPARRIFITDCEGPISKNDNAYELTCHFVPNGDKVFSTISRYDDVLADILKREDYEAGDTLKLILPFLKAFGVTNRKIYDFSKQNILLVPGAKETMQFVQKTMPSFIVSTSYGQYLSALCKAIGFPVESTYGTKIDLDKYEITESDSEILRQIAEEIAAMSMIEIPKNAEALKDFSSSDRMAIRRLDNIFWKTIPSMSLDKMFYEVNPIGGKEKTNAVRQIVAQHGCSADSVMYVGDSITDEECFRFVRDSGGLAVSFNGNEYAVGEAEVAVMSENTIVTSVLADVFARFGKDAVVRLVKEWSLPAIEQAKVNPELFKQISRFRSRKPPKVQMINAENREKLTEESVAFRKIVRGRAIARLG